MNTARFLYSNGSSYDWPSVQDRLAARTNRGTMLALLLMAWVAGLDLLWPRTNVSILYVVPLTILAVSDGFRPWWRSVGLIIVLTYGIYFLKKAIYRPDDVESLFQTFRLTNRTLVAASIIGTAYVLSIWMRWTADQADPELSSNVQHQERELGSTLALLCCIPLVILIAAVDVMAPATYNLAVFYPIPLFLCVWIQSRRLLWGMLIVLLALSFAAHMLGPPAPPDIPEASLLRNRFLGAGGLIVLAALLSWRMVSKSDESA